MESEELVQKISNPGSVISTLRSLLFSTNLSDCSIILEDTKEVIPAHSQILAASSPYFATILYGPYVEGSSKTMHISDIDSETFRALIRFMYTGEAEISISNLVYLVQAANRFCITEAMKEFSKTAARIIDSLDTSEDSITTLAQILQASCYLKLEEIAEMCFDYIDINTNEFLQSTAFLEISYEVLELILKRDTLFDGLPEICLYLCVLRWARGAGSVDPKLIENFDLKAITDEKLELIQMLMSCIRLPLIEAKYIINKIDKSGLFTKEQLYESMAYQASPESYSEDIRFMFKERKGSKKPWDWSDEKIGPHILLSTDKKLAIAHHYDWEKVLGTTTWHAGVHIFKVQLELNISVSSNSWQIIVGVASPLTSVAEHLGAGPKEWGLACYSGHKISCGDKREEYTISSRRGDIITVKVDLSTKRLEFFKNGTSLGVAFNNVVAPVCPAVSLLKGQRVKLIWD